VVRVGGFVVTTGEPVVVIVLDNDTVRDPLTLFVAYGVVGAAHAVGVCVILIVPVLEPGALELAFRVTVTERVVDCVWLEEALREAVTVWVTVGVPRRVPEIVPVGEGNFELDPVLQGEGSAVADGCWEIVGDPVGLRGAVGLSPGVPESGGLSEAAVEGDTVALKLGMLIDACGVPVTDCVELADTLAELLSVPTGVKLPRGVPEPGPLAETAGEELPALLKDPTELIDA